MSNKLYEENDIQAIANAIRSKNGSSSTYTVAEMAQAVSNIPTGSGGTNTSDATASAADILSPKTAYISSGKVTGNMPNNGSVNGTINTKSGSVTIPQGYTSGGSVTIAPTEVAKIIASNIKSGVTILGTTGTYSGSGGSSSSQTLNGNPFTCGAWTQVMDEYISVSITHGLGSTPSSIIIWAVPPDVSPYGIVTAVYLESFNYLSGVSYLDGTISDVESSIGSFIYSDSTTFTFDVPSGAILPAGWTYYWVVV